jgi:ATP-binding protein involved in chromosome partitioning
MSLNDAALRQAICTVVDPHTGQDFVASKALKALRIDGQNVSIDVELGYPAKSLFPLLRQQLVAAIKQVTGVGQVTVQLSSPK